jgi:putative membrane protein
MLFGLTLSWHWSPYTLLALLIVCLLYGGLLRLTYKDPVRTPLKKRRIVLFTGSVVSIAVILLSPLDNIARTQLFAAHMVQAVAITTISSPLLLESIPDWMIQPIVDLPVVRQLFQFVTFPIAASIIFNATFLIWHAPGLYTYALQQGTLYHVELGSFFVASLLNWWPLVGPLGKMRHFSYPVLMLYAFFDGQPVDIFAFLLVFTEVVIYHVNHIPASWLNYGYSPLADQTIAGAFLLVPGIVDLIVMSPLFFRWLAQIEERQKIIDLRIQERLEAQAALEAEEEDDDLEVGIDAVREFEM